VPWGKKCNPVCVGWFGGGQRPSPLQWSSPLVVASIAVGYFPQCVGTRPIRTPHVFVLGRAAAQCTCCCSRAGVPSSAAVQLGSCCLLPSEGPSALAALLIRLLSSPPASALCGMRYFLSRSFGSRLQKQKRVLVLGIFVDILWLYYIPFALCSLLLCFRLSISTMCYVTCHMCCMSQMSSSTAPPPPPPPSHRPASRTGLRVIACFCRLSFVVFRRARIDKARL
jgi:hypothetical protein